jgi:hypothetical protein
MTNKIGIEILGNEMQPQENKNLLVIEQPAASLMNSSIEGKTFKHNTVIIIQKHQDSR